MSKMLVVITTYLFVATLVSLVRDSWYDTSGHAYSDRETAFLVVRWVAMAVSAIFLIAYLVGV